MSNQFMSTFLVVFNYLKSDLIKKQRTFKIGLITIFLVVFFTSLLLNTINLSSLIFLRLAENQAGETDLIMIPYLNKKDVKYKRSALDKLFANNQDLEKAQHNNSSFSESFKLIDFPEVRKKLMNEPFIKGVSPRWIFPINVSYHNLWATSNLVILNSRVENQYEFGRKINLPDLNYLECYVSESVFRSLKLDEGSFTNDEKLVEIKINLLSMFNRLGQVKDFSFQTTEEAKTNSSNKLSEEINKHMNNHTDDERLNNFGKFNITKLIEMNPVLKNLTLKINVSEVFSKLSNYNLPEIFYFPINQTYNLIFNSSQQTPNFDLNFYIVQELAKSFFARNRKLKNDSIFDFLYYESSNNSLVFNSTAYKSNTLSKDEVITLNVSRFLSKIQDNDGLKAFTNIALVLKVKGVVPTTSGKWPSALGNVVAIDSTYGKEYLILNIKNFVSNMFQEYFNVTIDTTEFEGNLQKEFDGFNLDKYALTVNVILKDKFNIYRNSDESRRQNLVKAADKVLTKLGYDFPVMIQNPLYQSFTNINIVKIFLDNIFASVSFFLVILCTILIYSLILGNVDERNYEFGILRALGYRKQNLIILIVFQAFIFSIPAIIISLVVTYIINVILSIFLFRYSGLNTSFHLFPFTIYWGVISGITIPLISSYLPIKKALSENLKEALTIFNKKITDISVNIIKLEKLGVSPAAVITSLVMIVMGFSTYYLAPMCFLLSNYSMFLFILNVILIVMIIGLILVMQLIVPKLEKIVLHLIMCLIRKDRNIKFVVMKNLQGHSRRNTKTSIMFMISLSFVIFAGCTIELISNFISDVSRNIFASDIWVMQASKDDSLNEKKISIYLNDLNLKFPGNLKNYSFSTYDLDDEILDKTYFSNLCGYPNKYLALVGVPENLLYSTFSDIYLYSEINRELNYSRYRDAGGYDVVSSLFINKEKSYFYNFSSNNISYPSYKEEEDVTLNGTDLYMIVSEGMRKEFAVSPDTRSFLQINGNPPYGYSVRITSMQIKIAGVPQFSSYSSISRFAPGLISIEQMNQIIQRAFQRNPSLKDRYLNSKYKNKIYDLARKRFLFIKFNQNTTRPIKDIVFMELQNLIDSDNTQVVMTDDLLKAAEEASDVLNLFFIIIGLIALILSFFLIWMSFYSNIRENICEYGIMRAIGLSKAQSLRVYLYEATVLIFSSIIIGTFIGIVVSTTLVLQFDLFSEFPFRIFFPFKLYFIQIFTGFILALLGSYYPTNQINKLSLVKILKGIVEE